VWKNFAFSGHPISPNLSRKTESIWEVAMSRHEGKLESLFSV